MAAVTYIAQDFKRFAASRKQVIDMQISSFGNYYRVSSEFLADDNYLNEGKTLVSTKALKIEITNAKKLLYCFFVTTFLNSFLVYLGDLFNYSCFIPLLSKLWSFFLFYRILIFQLHVTWIHMLIKYSIFKVSIVWDFLLLLLLFFVQNVEISTACHLKFTIHGILHYLWSTDLLRSF